MQTHDCATIALARDGNTDLLAARGTAGAVPVPEQRDLFVVGQGNLILSSLPTEAEVASMAGPLRTKPLLTDDGPRGGHLRDRIQRHVRERAYALMACTTAHHSKPTESKGFARYSSHGDAGDATAEFYAGCLVHQWSDCARSCDVNVEHSPASLEHVRETAQGVLHDWQVQDEQAEDVVLVISELVANAVLHALPPVVLRLSVPCSLSTVHIEVSDGGPPPVPIATHPNVDPDEHGRGSTIVACLSQRTGHKQSSCGATHWADVAV